MNVFRQHVPRCVDIEADPPRAFSTTAELLALEVVQRFGKGKNFSHFAMSGNHLMEISDDGFMWWVIGTVAYPDAIELPKWDGGKYRAELPDGTQTILSKEVASSCGDTLYLTDGTRARNIRTFTRT